MKTEPLFITNNDEVCAYCKGRVECKFLAGGTYLEVLYAARDYIHQGHKLLSHPMAGSLKPNQTPFKTIALDALPAQPQELYESVRLIENSIEAAKKFFNHRGLPPWPEKIKRDFMTVDLSFMKGFVDNFSNRQA